MPKKGYKQTEEHRRKLKGKVPWNKDTHIQTNTGKTHFRKGQHPSLKTEFQKGNKINLGKKNVLGKHWKVSEQGRKNNSEGQKGKKLSVKTRKKMSEVCKGDKNPNWKGGATPKNLRIRMGIEFRLWRESVFARDNWTCQKYKIRGCKLHPHHIKNFAQYSELRFAIDNGITLSEKAHREFHKKYGYKNNTKEQLEEFFN